MKSLHLPRESIALPLNDTHSLTHAFFSFTVPPSLTVGLSKDSTAAISSDEQVRMDFISPGVIGVTLSAGQW